MIITQLTGGLGNQMFQYAAGLALAHRHRTALKLDLSWFELNLGQADLRPYAYGLHCFNVMESVATRAEIAGLTSADGGQAEKALFRMAVRLGLHRLSENFSPREARMLRHEGFGYNPLFERASNNTYMTGVALSERYFIEVADDLRLHFSFRYPPAPDVGRMAERIGSCEAVGLHFRRGDYASAAYNKTHGLLPMSYYEAALGLLRERLGDFHLFIFSDDIDGVEREFKPDTPHTFVRCGSVAQPHDELRLMSLCRHNVIANSTFSWWAAWLNANPGKLVIAPDPFFPQMGEAEPDLLPDNWIKIPIA